MPALRRYRVRWQESNTLRELLFQGIFFTNEGHTYKEIFHQKENQSLIGLFCKSKFLCGTKY
jgi:hypothetical protein